MISASVRASTDEVASSRIRIRGSASSARAIATRWRWPPESGQPALADDRVVAVRQAGDELVRLRAPRRRLDLLAARVRAARRRCCRRPCRRRGSCRRRRRRSRGAARRGPPRGCRRRRSAPALAGVVEPREQRRPGWSCPTPVGPTSATVRPGSTSRLILGERRLGAVVAQGHALERPGRRPGGSGGAPGGLVISRLAVEDLEHAVARRRPPAGPCSATSRATAPARRASPGRV